MQVFARTKIANLISILDDLFFFQEERQWYSLQNFLGIGHYEIVSNAENWLDNNRYDSISQKWIGPDSTRINDIDAEAKKQK